MQQPNASRTRNSYTMPKSTIAPPIKLFSTLLFLSSFQRTDSVNVISWDLLVFTQSWPITVCQEWKEVDSSHECAMPWRLNGWTIHGIWPDQRGGVNPYYCNSTWPFNLGEIRSIEILLYEFWKNVKMGTPIYDLWEHEWDKHGTCAAVINPLNSQLKYFQQGLSWAMKFSINDILAISGITPSQDKLYPLSDINTAIKREIGVNPMIVCYEKDSINYIVEVRICFDKNLELTGCEGILKDGFYKNILYNNLNDDVLSNCDRSKQVAYVSRVPHSLKVKRNLWFVQFYKLMNWLQWFTL